NGRTALALGVGCYMSNDLSAAQKINKAVSVVVLVRSQRFDSYTLCSLTPDHLLGRLPLCSSGGLTDFEIDQKPVSVLHQRMRPVTQLGLFARPLAGQQTLGVGLRLMGVVTALLTVKVHPTVARVSLIFVPRSIFALGAKALETCPRLNQGPVDREMIVAHQLGFSRLSDHGVEKQSPHFVLHQPITILAKHRGIEALFLKLHVQKPAKQQIVAHLLAQLPLAPDRIQRHQQQRLQYLLRCHGGPSHVGIHPIKDLRQFPKLLIRHCFDPSQWMVARNTGLYENSANILACLSCVPRINTSEDTFGGDILTWPVIFRVKNIFQTRSFSATC